MRAIVDAGIRPTHLDTHKHTHLAPPVLDAVARLARSSAYAGCGGPSIFRCRRCAAAYRASKRLTSDALGLLRRRFHRVLERHGCRTTDHFAGFQITGRFRTAELVELMAMIPEGSTELMVHPGHCGAALRAAPHAVEGEPRSGTGGAGGAGGTERDAAPWDRAGEL